MASFLLSTFMLLQNVFGEMHSMNGTVYYDIKTSSYSIKLGEIDCNNGVACGYFNDTLNITGWGNLEIKTTKQSSIKNITDKNRMFAAGYLEGYITSYQIANSYFAGWEGEGKHDFGPYTQQIKNWTNQQSIWINQQINNNPNDLYWQYMEYLQAQYNGLKQGYNQASKDFNDTVNVPLFEDDFIWQYLNANAEWDDLVVYFQYFVNKTYDMNDYQANYNKLKQSHCSVLIKVTPELDDIYFSHSTWSDYFWMNRIMKRYIFDLEMETSSTELFMSSYPGTLSSIDDYYLMDNGMAVTETTNLIYNNSLYSVLTPNTLFVWQRVRIANALSDNGLNWCNTFSKYNSGTYNNQWMVLNHKLFEASKQLNNELLYILEQIPGNVSIKDVTYVLERGYWGSYNVPAIEYIYHITGNAEMANKYGLYMSYDLAPRARIFRRDANNVLNMEDNKKFMRYNNYLNDPIEHDSPAWAIMSRFDLNASDPQPFGGMDSKCANLKMLQDVSCIAQNGPTHDNLPAFSFAGTFGNTPHQGMPTTFDFDWVYIPKSDVL